MYGPVNIMICVLWKATCGPDGSSSYIDGVADETSIGES